MTVCMKDGYQTRVLWCQIHWNEYCWY